MDCRIRLESMQSSRKNMPNELQELQERLRTVLRANMGEARRTRALLRDIERKVEEQFGHLDFIESSWYIAGKKFRKEPVEESLQIDEIFRSAEHHSERASLDTRSNAPRSANGRALQKSPAAQDIAPLL
jgi:hypothetical protein